MTQADKYVRVCPHCIETVSSSATACKFCGADLTTAKGKDAQPRLNMPTGSLGAVGCVAGLAFGLFLTLVIIFAALQFSVGR